MSDRGEGVSERRSSVVGLVVVVRAPGVRGGESESGAVLNRSIQGVSAASADDGIGARSSARNVHGEPPPPPPPPPSPPHSLLLVGLSIRLEVVALEELDLAQRVQLAAAELEHLVP